MDASPELAFPAAGFIGGGVGTEGSAMNHSPNRNVSSRTGFHRTAHDDDVMDPNQSGRKLACGSLRSLRLGTSKRYRCAIIAVLCTLSLLANTAPQCTAQDNRGRIDAPTVQRAIDRGVEYLRKSQTDRGGWDEFPGQSCGLSSLCTLAWLNAGVSRNDPDMVRALNYLRRYEPTQTYAVSLQTLVFCHVGALEDLPRIRRNVAWMAANQKTANSRNPGAWDYGDKEGGGDPSNSQFALLALGEAVNRGVEVDPVVFQRAQAYWRNLQLQRGGWPYRSIDPTGSMTCAGIGSLLIAQDALSTLDTDQKTLRCCDEQTDDPAIEKGFEFLTRIFTVETNPGSALSSDFYYLYAIERVGRLSGRRLIGGHDWYREGAEHLVSLQDAFRGFWIGSGPAESKRDVATSFALLFLSKGKRQVVVGQLDHPTLRTLGANNTASLPFSTSLKQLVRHVERDWSQDLTWQTIQAEGATVADLLRVPVIVIRGSQRIQFSNELVDTLEQYIDQGGTILFDAIGGDGCGDASGFQASVIDLSQRWFPGSQLERLPPSHPVWFAERPVDPTAIGPDFWVYGVGACCRTPVFYSPRSLSCRWKHGGPLLRNGDMPAALRPQIEAGISIGENIIAYATGRELKNKLDAASIVDGSTAPPPTRGAIPIAVGALGAGEKQVLRALPNAATLIREKLAIEVIAVNDPIDLTEESLARVGVLYLHGQTAVDLKPSEKDALRAFASRGGIIIASPICGSEAFGTSIRSQLADLFSGESFEPMAKEHPAWTTRYGGYDLSDVTVRRSNQTGERQKNQTLKISRVRSTPIIDLLQVDDQAAVYYSPLDLSCALESQNSVQCPGYNTTDAARILAGLILYSLNR
ncbi:DUF4159 domain-containing protein [Rhodopirellula bahusiensis]|uniref:DUF4159 domain-containing protein n=4 Tax=Rhodopirellula bahusiensis TaxID=2014065 RepID=UPI003D64A607